MKNSAAIIFIMLISSLLVLGLFDVALGVIAIIPLIILIKYSIINRTIELRLISITYIIGSLICWLFGFLACLYIGIRIAKYPIVTLILINLVTWGALIGSLLAVSLNKKNKSLELTSLPEKLGAKAFRVTAIIFVLFTIANYAAGGFNARFEVGNNLEAGSALYFVRALSILQSLVFLFAGTRLSLPLFSLQNIALMLGSLISALILSLSGGREGTLRAIIYFLLGTFYSKIKFKQIKILLLSAIPIVLTLIIFLGFARDNSEFADADIPTRIQLIFQVIAQGGNQSGTDYDNPLFLLFTRLTEPSGQFVIDNVVESEEYIGFQNLDRVIMIFVPKIFFPGDKVYDDSNERLENQGITGITEFTNPPLTLMADSFERGGYLGVFVVSVIVSFCLTFVAKLINNKLNSSILKLVLLGSLAISGIRIYSSSILDFISFITYGFARDAILVWFLFRVLGIIDNQKRIYKHN